MNTLTSPAKPSKSDNVSQSKNIGHVTSIRGSVVDIRFDQNLPPIRTMLITGKNQEIQIEVLSQTHDNQVRGIALTPTQGLARGMEVLDTGGPLKAPVGKEILSRMFDVFGNVIDRPLPKFLKRELKSSIFWRHWSEEGKLDSLGEPVWEKLFC